MTITRPRRVLKSEPFVAYVLSRLAPADGLVLDVGCGPALYRRSSAARYVGLDVIDCREAGEEDGADVIAASNQLPFLACFDLAFVKSALYLMPDPDAVLRDIHRVLKPGGRIVVFDYNRRTQRRF